MWNKTNTCFIVSRIHLKVRGIGLKSHGLIQEMEISR